VCSSDLCTFVALGCSPGARSSGDRRPLEFLVSADAETLDPRHAVDAVAVRTTRLVHAGLTRLDPDSLVPVPYVASRWQWLTEQRLRVELADGIRFHSGALLEPADVIETFAALADPAVLSRHARVVEAIDHVEQDGPRAVVFVLKRAHATLLSDLEVPVLRRDEARSRPDVLGTLDGLGPFRVAHRAPGETRLVPAQTGLSPQARHAVTIRTVRDENARALRMQAGRADLLVNGLSPTLLPALEHTPGLSVTARRGSNVSYMLFRADRGLLAEPRVRQAIVVALDRQRVVRTLLAGHATVAGGLVPPDHWAHVAQEPVARDIDRAKALVAQSHVAPIRLTLLTSTDRLRGTIARQFAQDLREAGVEVEVVPLEFGAMLTRLGAGDFELAMLQMPELTEPNVLRNFLHSASIPPAGANRGRVRDEELDALLEQGARQTSLDARRETYAKLEALVRERAWLVPLFHEDQIAVRSERASSFRPSSEGRWLDLANIP